MSIINEALMLEVGVESQLDYLNEYLIVSGGITLEEAQSLLALVISEAKHKMDKINDRMAERFKKIENKFQKMVAGKEGPAKAAEYKAAERAKVIAWGDKLRELVNKEKRGIAGNIKLAYGTMHPKTKIGLGVAGAAGLAAGGYAAYRKAKKK